jgi:hypothetical protein
MEDNKDKLIIDTKDTQDIIDRDNASSALARTSMVFAGVAIFFCIFNLTSIVHYLRDDTVPLVDCPRSFELDAPVIMKTISSGKAEIQDRRLRGFIRRYITAQLPRTEEDVVPFFTFIVDHSTNFVKDRYESFLNSKLDISNFIKSGYYMRFYPKFALSSVENKNPEGTSDSGLRIRKSDTPDLYIIEQDGYLVKRMGKVQERTNIVLRYEVKTGQQTRLNPEGLYVVGGTIDKITDFITGNKETKEHF